MPKLTDIKTLKQALSYAASGEKAAKKYCPNAAASYYEAYKTIEGWLVTGGSVSSAIAMLSMADGACDQNRYLKIADLNTGQQKYESALLSIPTTIPFHLLSKLPQAVANKPSVSQATSLITGPSPAGTVIKVTKAKKITTTKTDNTKYWIAGAAALAVGGFLFLRNKK